MAIGIGVSVAKSPVLNRLYEAKAYSARVVADSGEVANNAKLRELILMLKAQGLYDNTKLLIAPVLGGKWRTSGIYKYASKLYSVNLAANDATQTAEVSQPYQSGNIAPTELLSIKNPNGDARYLSHPSISYTANEAWSVSVMVNYNKNQGVTSYIFGDSTYGIGISGSVFLFRNIVGLNSFVASSNGIVGKTTLLTFVADGTGNIRLYINGSYQNVLTVDTSITISQLLLARSQFNYQGTLHYYRIQSGAMTAGQITAEYNLLRSWIAEIESVTIGTQTWATSNLAAVATPLGNVINEVQTAGAVEKIINAADREFSSDTGFWTKSAQVTIASGVLNIKSTDGSLQSATSQSILTTSKYYKLTYSVKRNAAGAIVIAGTSDITLDSSVGDGKIKIYKTTVTSLIFKRVGVTDIDVDDVSVQELNWSDATLIYDAVYAATSGTAAEKHYAAVKEAAMWCHYDNSTANGAVYNKLYNWYAASLFDLDMASAGYGWHVPTSAEFTTLQTYLGGASVAGGKLKMTGTNYWNSPNTGADNSSGFTALGGGWRSGDTGAFNDFKNTSLFITSDNVSAQNTYYLRCVSATAETATLLPSDKRRGYFIRLIKNT